MKDIQGNNSKVFNEIGPGARNKHIEMKNTSYAILIKVILILGITAGCFSVTKAQQADPSPIHFPVPQDINNQLFYLQRDPNKNTIVCQLNTGANGLLVKDEPIQIYWIRYEEDGGKKELNYIQRKFAYGIQTRDIGNGQYELRFVSHKSLPMYLTRSAADNKYHVYVTANNRKIQLERIFLRIEGGSFWLPNVKYVELKGFDASDPTKVVIERIKV